LEQVARLLVESGAVLFGDFVLSSGKRSKYYVDMRRCLSKPPVYEAVVDELARLASKLEFEVVAGVATGGLPWAAMLSLKLRAPLVYVRTEKKEHGTMGVVEGFLKPSTVAVVVDDVATTGSSIERAVLALRELGAVVRDAVVIVDREEGAKERLAQVGVSLHSLVRASQLLKFAGAEQRT